MICPNCGTWLNVERPTCPSCGAPISRLTQAGVDQSSNVLMMLQQEKDKKKTFRIVGLILIIIGLALIPFIYFTLFMFVGWFICGGIFVFIGAGIIIILTNLNKKYDKI